MNKKLSILGLLFIAVAFGSCIKKEVTPLGEEGKTFVKILGGGTPAPVKKNPIDFINTPQQILVMDLRKDAANNASLNTTTTVVVKDDEAAVTAAGYQIFPAAWYTIQSEAPKVGGAGGTWTFTFNAGDFGKQIFITIPNAQVLDPSALYGLGFTIQSVSSDGTISTQKSIIIEIGAKNDWDGTYAVRGPVVDVVTPNLLEWANQLAYTDPWLVANPNAWEAHLVTASGTECVVWDNTLWGWPALPLYNNNPPGNTGYGGFGMVFKFDPATSTVVQVRNWYGDPSFGSVPTPLGNPISGSGPPLYQASNTRYALIDPSGANIVQGNRDILVKYWMYHPSVLPGGPRTTIDNHYEYLGPR